MHKHCKNWRRRQRPSSLLALQGSPLLATITEAVPCPHQQLLAASLLPQLCTHCFLLRRVSISLGLPLQHNTHHACAVTTVPPSLFFLYLRVRPRNFVLTLTHERQSVVFWLRAVSERYCYPLGNAKTGEHYSLFAAPGRLLHLSRHCERHHGAYVGERQSDGKPPRGGARNCHH